LFDADTTYNEATISLPFPVQATFLEELRLEDQYNPLNNIYLEMVAVEENNYWSSKKKAKLVSMKAAATD
jgi:hypothetical protein